MTDAVEPWTPTQQLLLDRGAGMVDMLTMQMGQCFYRGDEENLINLRMRFNEVNNAMGLLLKARDAWTNKSNGNV